MNCLLTGSCGFRISFMRYDVSVGRPWKAAKDSEDGHEILHSKSIRGCSNLPESKFQSRIVQIDCGSNPLPNTCSVAFSFNYTVVHWANRHVACDPQATWPSRSLVCKTTRSHRWAGLLRAKSSNYVSSMTPLCMEKCMFSSGKGMAPGPYQKMFCVEIEHRKFVQ